MLAAAKQFETARALEAELLAEANTARSFDRMRMEQREANLQQLYSGKFEIIDIRHD